ncbi:UNVERIFIED_CONTAM: hypothetical protein RF648_21075, partial [Kocuria sp. CPCC 205274]
EAAQAMPLPNSAGGYNPFQQEENQQDSQGKHISNMEQWLAPVKIGGGDAASKYNDDKHDNFLSNWENDPVVKSHGEQFHAYLETLNQAVQAGQLSPDDANSMGQDYIDNVLKPEYKKHYSRSDKAHLHKVKEPEIPDIVKKVRGVK